MKPFIIALLVCMMFFFTGCGQKDSISDINSTAPPAPFSSSGVIDTETGGLILVTSPYGAFDETSGKDGFYKLYPNPKGGCNILYADYATHSAIVLCNRPDCLHQDAECPSWFPFGTGSIFLNAAQNTLFCIGNADAEAQRAETIWRMDLNGANRRILYQCAAHERITDAIASDSSFLYFSVSSVNSATAAAEKRLLQVDLQTGESQQIHTLGPSDWLTGVCGERLILLYSQNMQYRYTLFSPSDGTETEVFSFESDPDKPESSLKVSQNGGFLYVFSPNQDATSQLLKIDILSGESAILCDSFPWYGAGTAFVQGFYDHRLIIDQSDTRENDPAKARHYRYYIDCETGSYTESSLTYSQGALTSFVTIAAESPDFFVVSKGVQSTPIILTSNDGSTYEATFGVPEYAFISKADYWSNTPNYQDLDYGNLIS